MLDGRLEKSFPLSLFLVFFGRVGFSWFQLDITHPKARIEVFSFFSSLFPCFTLAYKVF